MKKVRSYGIQLEKTADLSDEVQLIAYYKFANKEGKIIVEHHLCCLKVGVSTTAPAIFDRLNQFFEEHGLDWTKCKSVTADKAAAMQDSSNKVVRKIKNLSPESVLNHHMIHQVAFVLKKLKPAL